MNLKDFIVDSINMAALQVFSTMLGVELAPGVATFDDAKPDDDCEVVSLIALTGSWVGSGSLNCSAALACRLCANMLMTEAAGVNEKVLDAVAELTNMIVGNVKTDLESELGPLGLSTPTVVYGQSFRTKNAGAMDYISMRFLWDNDYLTVKLRLGPHHKDACHRMRLSEEAAALAA